MLTRFTSAFVASLLVAGAATSIARADECSGHNHTTGTVLGAVGGGVIGGALTHGNIVGVAGGAVAGGLAGNAISRNMDCHHHRRYGDDRRRYWSERYHRYYYR